jgi:hypothetical protein
MTYKILMDDTRRIIHRSNICLVADPHVRNLCLDPLNDELPEVIPQVQNSIGWILICSMNTFIFQK